MKKGVPFQILFVPPRHPCSSFGLLSVAARLLRSAQNSLPHIYQVSHLLCPRTVDSRIKNLYSYNDLWFAALLITQGSNRLWVFPSKEAQSLRVRSRMKKLLQGVNHET